MKFDSAYFLPILQHFDALLSENGHFAFTLPKRLNDPDAPNHVVYHCGRVNREILSRITLQQLLVDCTETHLSDKVKASVNLDHDKLAEGPMLKMLDQTHAYLVAGNKIQKHPEGLGLYARMRKGEFV